MVASALGSVADNEGRTQMGLPESMRSLLPKK